MDIGNNIDPNTPHPQSGDCEEGEVSLDDAAIMAEIEAYDRKARRAARLILGQFNHRTEIDDDAEVEPHDSGDGAFVHVKLFVCNSVMGIFPPKGGPPCPSKP